MASGLLDILSSDYYPASLLDAAFRIADDEGNAFTLAQAIRLVSKTRPRRWGCTTAGRLPKVSGRTWCWRAVTASISILITSGGKARGSSDDRETDLAGRPSGSGKDSLLAALRQREHPQLLVAHRYITRPHNAGCENHIALSEHEFYPRRTASVCS